MRDKGGIYSKISVKFICFNYYRKLFMNEKNSYKNYFKDLVLKEKVIKK